MERVLRSFFLFLAKSKQLKKIAQKYGQRFGAKRFVAGRTLDEVVTVIKQLNKDGLAVTIDHLGEFVYNHREAERMKDICIQAIERIAHEELNAQVSLKLTSIGLDIDQELALKNLRQILDTAKNKHVFVTIDMEDYKRCQATLDLFKQVKKDYDNVGTVLQAYLYRTANDLSELEKINAHLRLCKGAYKESAQVAYPHKNDVDKNFKRLIKNYLMSKRYTAIATHDDQIIGYAKQLIQTNKISFTQFEFQMLYGICTDKQQQLVKEGYKMRVYVPYGEDWFGYFMRRLAERPANVWFILKNLF